MSNHTILYLECRSGISGDMTVAALLDLGASREVLEKALASMKLEGCHCHIGRVDAHGLDACDFDVHIHEHHEHDHEHGDDHHHHHHHEHRNLSDVCAVIDSAEITPNANALAKKIFRIVAEAEAKAHGVPLDEVHFHEVGALDSILDIVGAAVCIDDLGVTECVVSPLAEGSGFVRCQHGLLPVPVPAVAAICAAHRLPMQITDVQGEMVTPTGAAIAAALRTREALPGEFTIRAVGLGAGKRDFGRPNVVRAMLIEERVATQSDSILLLETNLDDCTGEALGLTMEALFAAGARDVHFVPVFMKKNRPGTLLRVITDAALAERMEEIIFHNTTTIGIRRIPFERTTLERELVDCRLAAGVVKVKRCRFRNTTRNYPEYESVKALAAKTGIEFQTLYRDAQQEMEKL